ncbi:outer membrane protein assembly factor BamA [Adhaeribacter terreus]|uniref:Outer membrane protein assembly factor BamA n=1 Tax=Adhaeribacter terreus TaxID=529703 RepID=A0ABW0E8C0_9BACT
MKIVNRLFGVFFLLFFCGQAFGQIRMQGGQDLVLDYTNPQKYEIGGITVSGTKFLDPATLIAITGLKVGDQIQVPGEDISKAINKLWAQGILGNIEVSATKVEGRYIFLDFYLTERPRLSKFTFKGVKKGHADELREKINLIRGKVVTDAVISNTKNIVRKYFLEKGYMNAKVNITQQTDSLLPNSVVLNIDIDKKEKVKIEEITFSGNDAIAEGKLQKQMKNTKERKFWKVFTSSKFLKTGFEDDKRAIVEYYNSQGYRDAQVVSDSVVKVSEDRIHVYLTVDEGRKYYFRNITWNGNYLYDDKYLAGILGIKKGSVYSKETLDKRLSYNPTGLDITSLYMDDGYLFFGIDPVEVLVENDSIDIEMRISEGAQARIKDVTVAGNTKTSDHVVLRELRTVPGQKFSRADLIRSRNEIANLGYFDPEQIGMNPIPNPQDGTVDIKYTVVEKPSDQFTLSGGWGGLQGFVGTAGFVFNNFSLRKAGKFKHWTPVPAGDGQRVSLNVQANGYRYQSYSLSFTEPWLGGRKPNSLSVSLSHTVSRLLSYAVATKTANDPLIKINGLSIGLGRRLTWPDDFFVLSHSLAYYQYKLNNYAIMENFDNGTSNSISLTNTLSRNSFDSPIYTKRGSSISLSVNLTPPYSLFNENRKSEFEWIEFHKWMFDASWFTNLAGNLVLNTRAHFGFLGSYNNKIGIGPFERFKLGGNGMGVGTLLVGTEYVGLRGYEDATVTPAQAGGVAFDKFVMELRYPITLNPSATVFVLGFAEAGNNFANYRDYNPYKLYRSVGVGARIFMAAFGLLGFDYGYGLDSYPATPGSAGSPSGGRFHFMIGQQIR